MVCKAYLHTEVSRENYTLSYLVYFAPNKLPNTILKLDIDSQEAPQVEPVPSKLDSLIGFACLNHMEP